MMRGVALVAAVIGVAAAVFAWRASHPPLPGALGIVPCRVSIAEPASGVATVRLELDGPALRNRRQLVLSFIDVRGTAQMVRSFGAQVDGKAVTPMSRDVSGVRVYLVPIDTRAGSLAVTYTIEPTYFPPGANREERAESRSRIAPELAIIRSSSLFPRIDAVDARLGVEFDLPQGWVAVTPWASVDGRAIVPANVAAPVEYFALGPFETHALAIGGTTVQVATPALVATGAFPVESILSRELELIAAPFKRPGPFLATIVPDAFMHGGAAGDHSIVQSSAPYVLAHEVFHWWNDATLTAADATWFREGLTEYYGIRVSREAGLSTPEAEAACFADLEAEMRRIETTAPRSLKEASLDASAMRLVYSKGALFWFLLDRQLRDSGRFLEEAVRRVVASPREGLRTEDLEELFSNMYGGAVDEAFDRYVTGATRLPNMGLPPATGRSGCARN